MRQLDDKQYVVSRRIVAVETCIIRAKIQPEAVIKSKDPEVNWTFDHTEKVLSTSYKARWILRK